MEAKFPSLKLGPLKFKFTVLYDLIALYFSKTLDGLYDSLAVSCFQNTSRATGLLT